MELFENARRFPIREDMVDRIPVFLFSIANISRAGNVCESIRCSECPFDSRANTKNYDLCRYVGKEFVNFEELKHDFLEEIHRRGVNHGTI